MHIICMHMYLHVCTYMYVCIRVGVCMCVYVWVCICVGICICYKYMCVLHEVFIPYVDIQLNCSYIH